MSAESFRRIVAEPNMVSSEIARVAWKRPARELLRMLVVGMSESELQSRLPEFARQAMGMGETILREGDPPDRFYLLHRRDDRERHIGAIKLLR